MIVESLLELLRATPHQLHNMPFSELIRFAKGKVDPTNLPSDISIQGDIGCCELVYENGQVTMRNQAIRERKGSSSNNPKPAKNSKAKFSSIDSVLNDFPLSAPPCDMSLDEDDNTVPWLNCPVVEPFNNVYCSDILHESFGASGSEFAHSNSTAAKAPRSANSDLDCSEFKNSTAIKLQKNNSGQPNNNASGIMNFSYFSRFAANCKQTAGNEKNNHMGSAFVNSSVGFPQQESAPPKSESSPAEQSVARCREKAVEPAVATSSVCSGNSLERDSSNPLSSLKRKCFETGDSEGPSEEVEDESVGVQKTAPSRSGSKRSRAAEVHNQSERRRRERINEKMRALQELIPNCNKVDKASMLDEAIEYLKTLQLQVQILSMGTGLYMSQMMLPAALQHMHRAHMPQFSAMGMGMGAALGFGMSMQPDVNSMMQMPCIQPPYFPSSGFYGAMSSSSHQTPANLGQGLSASMGNVSGMPLPNTSMNQLPNQETMVINDQFQASNVHEAQKR